MVEKTFLVKEMFLQSQSSYDILQLINSLIGQFSDVIDEIFIILVLIAILVANITVILGGITYLIDYNEINGKLMIARSIVVLALLLSIFRPFQSDQVSLGSESEFFEDYLLVFSYVITYLLFVFASLALIFFIANLGLYLVDNTSRRAYNVKKSFICLICIFLPIGLQFPRMPQWIW